MKMKNKIMIFGGLLAMVMSFVIGGYVEKSSLFNETASYTVISKHESSHEHKGRLVFEYYLKYKFKNETITWTRSIRGEEYFSREVNSTYQMSRPISNNVSDYTMYSAILLCIIGLIAFSIGAGNES